MADENVTPIRVDGTVRPIPKPTKSRRVTKDVAGIAAPPIDFAASVREVLDEQLPKMGEAMAVVTTCKAVIRSVYECDDVANPQIDGALGAAYRMLDDIFCAFLELEGKLEKLEAAPAVQP